MEERGFTVGPNNRVVPAILRGMPQQAAFALMNQVAPVMEMLTAPQNQVCTRMWRRALVYCLIGIRAF
jgi:hypothetical protein